MKKALLFLVVVALSFGTVGMANAALIIRGTDSFGNKLIYDDDLGITWYDYTNLELGWEDQMAWADGLSVSYNGDTLDDWRLSGSTEVSGVTEMEHLYYEEFGLLSYFDRGSVVVTSEELNESEFDNLVAEKYWTSTTGTAGGDVTAYWEDMERMYDHTKIDRWTVEHLGLAVRDGDVAALPIPSGMWLLGSGLIGLVGVRKKMRKV